VGALAVVVLSLTLVGCAGKKKSQEIAMVDGQPVTAMDVLMANDVSQRSQLALNGIVEVLIQREAKRLNIEVSDEDVQAEIERLQEQMGGQEEFAKQLAAQGQKLEDLTAYLKNLRLKQLLCVKDVPEPTDEELQKFFKEHESQFGQPEQFKLRRLVATTKDQAEKAISRLKAGEDFAAVEKSLSPQAGQPAQWVPIAALSEDVQSAIRAAAPKGVTAPLEQTGATGAKEWWVLQVEDQKEANIPALDTIRDDVVLQYKLADPKAVQERELMTNLLIEKKIDIVNTDFAPAATMLEKVKTSKAGAGAPDGAMVPAGPESAPPAASGAGGTQ
jgi:hypothetical protein